MPPPVAPPDLSTETPAPLAPRWHTALLIALMLAVATAGLLLGQRGEPAAQPASPSPVARLVTVYLPMLLVQWGMVAYVSRVGRPTSALRSLLGARWRSLGRAAVDLSLALAGWAVIVGGELAWQRLFGRPESAAVAALLPRSGWERAAWVVVASSVGFCEEVVYRGYLQTQLAAFTGRASLGIALQAALFGLAHGEQGPAVMVRFAFYGLLFGALARWRKSLWPGIACHVVTDVASGLLG